MNKSLGIITFVLAAVIAMSGCSDLDVDYEFDGGQAFTDIQGTFSNKDAVNHKGYMYYFSKWPVFFDHPWDTSTLHSPALINGGNDVTQCWFLVEGWQRTLNFYCGGSATVPAKPPEGTYQVNVGTKTYTYNGVTSRTIDTALNDVYVPVIQLTMDGSGKISQINWQWWKKVAGTWSQPANTELASSLGNAGFESSQTGWVGDRVNGDIALTTSGQVIPDAQTFTPGVFRVSYTDNDGYSYGFEWQ